MQPGSSMFYSNEDNVLQGLFACHVDDFLHAGNEEFDNQIITKLKRRFQAGKLEETMWGLTFNKPIPQSC